MKKSYLKFSFPGVIVNRNLFILMLLFLTGNLVAQNNSSLSGSEIIPNAVLSHTWSDILNTNISVNEAKTYVAVQVLDNITDPTKYDYEITLSVQPRLADETLGSPEEKVLKVSYNNQSNGPNYVDKQTILLENSYGAEIKVLNINYEDLVSGSVTNTTPSNIQLKINSDIHYFEPLGNSLILVSPTVISDNNSVANALQLSWAAVNGVKRYQLEYSWVDNYGDAIALPKAAGEISFSERDFELNNTRIDLQAISSEENLNYTIPLTYSQGYLLFRVRGVGVFEEDQTKAFYGPWSSGTGMTSVQDWVIGNSAFEILNDHEQIKNWQFQASFAENGKRKEVISYFDGTLRNRQTVTKLNSENTALAGEVIYDNQGRAAVEVLPVPTDENFLKYYPDFNLNTAVQPVKYTHQDFDWDDELSEGCEILTNGMSTLSGASKYYSSNNEITGGFQDFVPDAQLFPFNQIEYTPDMTGRVRRKGGVGPEFQLGTSHEMIYYYSQPASSFEVNRLFGYQVGDLSHYKKNTVKDPNGQLSVSYLDLQGRTVATALVGDNPLDENGNSIFNALEDENNTSLHDQIMADLMQNNELYSSGRYYTGLDGSRVNKTITASSNGLYIFDYGLAGGDFVFDPNCPSSYPFIYDLEISFADDCGNALFEQGNINLDNIQNYNGEALNANLVPGEYNIVKNLMVDEEAAELAWQNFISNANQSCILSYEDFITTIFDCEKLDCSLVNQGEEAYVNVRLGEAYQDGVDYSLGNGVFTIYNAELETEIDALYLALVESYPTVQDLCTDTQLCEIQRETLLADVSPNGQFGNVEFETDVNTGESLGVINHPLSVFNDGTEVVNQIFANGSSVNNNWRNPIRAYKDNSDISYVEVRRNLSQPGGWVPQVIEKDDDGDGNNDNIIVDETAGIFKVLPQNLARVEDFLVAWKPGWAESLLEYHPEYCYLEYSEDVCSEQKEWNNLTSYEFDDFLITQITSYADAEAAGLIGGNFNEIMDSDPYFRFEYSSESSDTGFDYVPLRRAIMEYALEVNYEGLGDNMIASNPSDIFGMLSYSIAIEKYGSLLNESQIQQLPDTALGLYSLLSTTEEKDLVWQQFVNNYIGLKQKIFDVFIDLHAIKGGCYNSCLNGEIVNQDYMASQGYDISTDVNTSSSFATPIHDYLDVTFSSSSVRGALAQLISMPSPSLCDNEVYSQNNIVPRFPGSDFLLNTEIYDDGSGNSLGETNYYELTGKCETQIDLEVFLNGFFEERTRKNISLTSNLQFNGKYLPIDLFQEFGGTNGQIPTFQGQVSGTTLSLIIGNIVNPTCSSIVELVAPEGYSWGTYGSSWNFVAQNGISEIYYIKNETLELSGRYQFQILGRVTDGTTISEVVLNGTSCAKLDSCIEECSDLPMHLAFNMLFPGEDPNFPYTYNDRYSVVSSIANWQNRYVNDNTIISNNDVASDGIRFNAIKKPITTIDSIYNSAGEPKTIPQFYRIQNQKYQNAFKRTLQAMNDGGAISNNYLPAGGLTNIDMAFFIQGYVAWRGYLQETVDEYVQLTNNNAKRAFFIFVDEEIRYIRDDWDQWYTKKQFLKELLQGRDPVSYETTGSIFNSDYIMLEREDPDFEIKLTNFLNAAYNELKSEEEQIASTCGCIIQPVAPKSCNDMWALYNSYFGFTQVDYTNNDPFPDVNDPAGYTVNEATQGVPGYQLPDIFTEDYFCGMNYGYITEEYLYYLDKVAAQFGNITPDHPLFLNIGDFGNTNLNYGFDSTQQVIDAYFNVVTVNIDGEPSLSWGTFVNGDETTQGWITLNDPCLPASMIPEVRIDFPGELQDPCEQIISTLTETYTWDQYNSYLSTLRDEFIAEYSRAAIENAGEVFTMQYPDKEYQYTLYYYDQAGNLTQTVPPQGVKRLGDGIDVTQRNALDEAIKSDITNNTETTSLPAHDMRTQYRYNSLNQLVWQKTPDGGETYFAYDKLGRIIASQNAIQTPSYNQSIGSSNYQFSYTRYDGLGRIIESGQIRLPLSTYNVVMKFLRMVNCYLMLVQLIILKM